MTKRTNQAKGGGGWASSWLGASGISVGIVLSLWLLLGFVPHRLTLALDAIRSAPWLRDVLVTGFFTMAFCGIAYGLRVLQKRGWI